MKKILFILIFVWFAIDNLQSQNLKDSLYLHLVMFTSRDLYTYFDDPTTDEEMDSTKKALLWRLESDSLKLLDTLNLDPSQNNITEMYECKQFSEKKWIYIMEREFFPTYFVPKATEQDSFLSEDTFISVLDYSGDSIIIRRLKGSQYNPFYKYSLYTEDYYYDAQLWHLYSYDLSPFKVFIISKSLENGHEIKKDIYADSFYIKRESGIFSRFNAFFMIRKDNEVKKRVFERNKYPTLEDWPKSDMIIPVGEDEYKYYSSFEFLLRTPQNRYIIGRKKRHKPNTDSLELYYVFDKETQIWDTIYMPNDVRNFNIYKDRYLYGTLWRKCTYCRDYKPVRDSVLALIKKYPKKYSWKYSNYPNLAHCSGKFFIYDLERRKYVEMKAEDRDAELIEIIDGWIYYRVYDEIRRMKLGLEPDYFDKSTVEVLVKNKEVIPNVHHIFLKEKCPVVEEWITPDPHKKRKAFKVKIGK